MLPMKALRLALGTSLAANTSFLAPAVDPNVVALIMSDFTENEDLVVGDVDLANFTGSQPIEGDTGAQWTGQDPITGQQIIRIKVSTGGWRWETADSVNLPQTIYGYALLKNDLSVMHAIKKFATPIPLTNADQEVNIDDVDLTFVLQPLS